MSVLWEENPNCLVPFKVSFSCPKSQGVFLAIIITGLLFRDIDIYQWILSTSVVLLRDGVYQRYLNTMELN